MEKRIALIGVLLLVILALLLRRRQINIQQVENLEQPPINIGGITINTPGLVLPDFPTFTPPPFLPSPEAQNNFDWINTTSIACNCNARTVSAKIPIISQPVYIDRWIMPPASPYIFGGGSTPIFNPPPPPRMITWRKKRLGPNGPIVTFLWQTTIEQEYNDAVISAKRSKENYDRSLQLMRQQRQTQNIQFMFYDVLERR
jgi:hypothetical protein